MTSGCWRIVLCVTHGNNSVSISVSGVFVLHILCFNTQQVFKESFAIYLSRDRCISSHDRCISSHDRCISSHDRCISSHDRCISSHDRCISSHESCGSYAQHLIIKEKWFKKSNSFLVLIWLEVLLLGKKIRV